MIVVITVYCGLFSMFCSELENPVHIELNNTIIEPRLLAYRSVKLSLSPSVKSASSDTLIHR